MKHTESAEIYRHKLEILGELEKLSENHLIDLYYADERRVSVEPCIPYGWQFADEEVFMPAVKGNGVNCFALMKRNNQCLVETSQETITGEFILEKFENFSLRLSKLTVIVWTMPAFIPQRLSKNELKVGRPEDFISSICRDIRHI